MTVAQTTVRIDPQDLKDAATFFGISEEACFHRVVNYHPRELAEYWRKLNPRTPEEIRHFYQSTDLYIWELLQWHAVARSAGRMGTALDVIESYPVAQYPRVLDFGCGIGTVAIRFAEQGYDVTVADVPGPTIEFARHRFRSRGLKIEVIEVEQDLPILTGTYDIMVCLDVVEHVPEPDKLLFHLARNIRTDGIALIQASFGTAEDWPQHLMENWLRFAPTNNWWVYCKAAGLDEIKPDIVYKKTSRIKVVFRRMWHWFWLRTGIFPSLVRIPRHANELGISAPGADPIHL